MPELPEVEITVRRLRAEVVGQRVTSAVARGINTLKTYAPPLDAIVGSEIIDMRRRGKLILIDFDVKHSLLLHLMTSGRLQYLETPSSESTKNIRFAVGLSAGGELCLREFGTRQLAWAKLLPTSSVKSDKSMNSLGPEAWPNPPRPETLPGRGRQLHTWLRDQHVMAGVGRAWCDEIMFDARLSPFQKVDRLTSEETDRLHSSIATVLDRAINEYERTVQIPIPAKLAKPLLIHGHEGDPCPSCRRTFEAVHFSNYVIVYCPNCQNDGHLYKDRRMSKLLR